MVLALPSSVTRPVISPASMRSEEHTSELQSQSNLVCRLLLEKKKTRDTPSILLAPCLRLSHRIFPQVLVLLTSLLCFYARHFATHLSLHAFPVRVVTHSRRFC